MWNRLSFRLKITVIFFASLLVLTVALTALSLMNAQQNITNPMRRNIELFTGIHIPNPQINYNESLTNYLTEEQLEELINLLPEGDLFIQDESDIQIIDRLQIQLNDTQRNFRQYHYWVVGVVIILGSLMAYWVSGVVVRPIKKLSTSVEEIEADKLNKTLPLPKSHDEISQLTVAFNEMLNKLHRSFESKQLFAQNAAHELKTPLAIIRAHMEALAMDDNPTADDYEEVFIEVKNNTERMIGLVEGLLAMGKRPAEADMILFQGREIFEDIFLDLKDSINDKQLNIQTIGDLTIKGEKTQLLQAFFNLIYNAVRYNINGGNIVVTMTENQITIEDTGIGIPSESIGQLFDPFYCVDKSRSKQLGGNGLGLSITKDILDAHNMNIEITSNVGTGTLITIRI